MDKKKVVIVGNSDSPHVLNRISRFAKVEGFDFSLFDTNFDSENVIAIPRVNRRGPKFLDLLRIGKAFKLLSSFSRLITVRPNILFIMYCSKLSLLYSLFFRGKVILSFWGSDILNRNGKKKSFFVNLIQKQALLKADLIYCVSKELVDEVCNVAGTKLSTKPRLLMYGLDLNLYNSPEPKKLEQIEPFTIYSPRWCLPIYNIEVIIDAVILLLQSGKKVRLIYRNVYIDNSPIAESYSAKILDKIINSGFANNFQAVGLLENNEQISLIKNANIVISVSHFDGTPLSILEAMACKTLTLSGKIPSTTNFIKHGINGYLVNKDNPSEIANQLALIIEQRNSQKEIIENARLFVEQHADINLEVDNYVKSFHEV